MKKAVSILMMLLLAVVFTVPAFATDAPSVSRPDPVVVPELPDANEPDAPPVVTVEDPTGEDEPGTYYRVPTPETENTENPEYEYVPENEVPLTNLPDEVSGAAQEAAADLGRADAAHVHFGDLGCWLILILSVLGGLILGIAVGRGTKKDKKDDENKN